METLLLLAQVEYLSGNYDNTEKLLQLCVEQAEGNVWERLTPEVYLIYLYYQTDQYAKGGALLKGMDKALKRVEDDIDEALMLWKLMKVFGQEPPNQIDWNGTRETVVPL